MTKAGAGTGTVSPPTGSTFADGTVVTLTATPAPGSTFTAWSGGGCNGNVLGTCDVTMTANITVKATFGRAAVPGAPRSLFVTPGNGQIRVTWQVPTSDGGSPITQYVVRADPGNGLAVRIIRLDVGVPFDYMLVGLTNGTRYGVSVEAVNFVGGHVSGTIFATPSGVPGAPLLTGVCPG